MNRTLPAFLALVVALSAVAGPPPHYYDAAQGKSGAALREALHQIVRGHRSLPYSSSSFDTSDALRVLDADPANPNNILGVYSHYSVVGTNIGSSASSWNREHLWCQSYGASSGPPRTDLHHLRRSLRR